MFTGRALPSAALTFREHTLALIWDTGRWGRGGLQPLPRALPSPGN